MKLFTEVSCEKLSTIARTDSVCVLGSCFADEIGARLADAGFDFVDDAEVDASFADDGLDDEF